MYSFSFRPREHSPYNRMKPPKMHVTKETWYSLSIQADEILEEKERRIIVNCIMKDDYSFKFRDIIHCQSYLVNCKDADIPSLNPYWGVLKEDARFLPLLELLLDISLCIVLPNQSTVSIWHPYVMKICFLWPLCTTWWYQSTWLIRVWYKTFMLKQKCMYIVHWDIYLLLCKLSCYPIAKHMYQVHDKIDHDKSSTNA